MNTQLTPNRVAFSPIEFGPRMIFTVITGKDFLELAHPAQQPQNDRAEEQGPLLLVTHDPECGPIIGSGNNGDDYFFVNKPLPPNCEVMKAAELWLDPQNDAAGIAWALKNDASWINGVLNDDYVDLAKSLVDQLVVLFGGGSYVCKFYGPQSPTQPAIRVHWENACWGPYNGVPIKYCVSFMLRGPEGIVPGTPVKP